MRKAKFMPLKKFDALVASGDWKAARKVAIEIATRWTWLNSGYVGLPIDFGPDVESLARRAIKAAASEPIPMFPVHRRDYKMTAQQAYDLLPSSIKALMIENDLLGQTPKYPAPAQPDELILWGRGALGDVPDLYAGPEMQFRAPGTFWDKANLAGGGEGYDFNAFELWLFSQEQAVYDRLSLKAERAIRSFWAGYVLERAHPSVTAEAVWQATRLPIPVLAWWARYWIRSVDSGRDVRRFAVAEEREKTIQSGMKAIADNGGWPFVHRKRK